MPCTSREHVDLMWQMWSYQSMSDLLLLEHTLLPKLSSTWFPPFLKWQKLTSWLKSNLLHLYEFSEIISWYWYSFAGKPSTFTCHNLLVRASESRQRSSFNYGFQSCRVIIPIDFRMIFRNSETLYSSAIISKFLHLLRCWDA